MTTDTEFWTHVDALLDARRDPFADAEVARALLHDPTRLAPLEALLARLDPSALATVAPGARATPTARAPTTRRAAAALLLFGTAALAAWLAARGASRELARPEPLVADTTRAEPASLDAADLRVTPDIAPATLARVVEFHASVRRERLGRAAPRPAPGVAPASTAHAPPRIHSAWRQTWSAP